MNVYDLSLDMDMILVHDALEFIRQTNSIVREIVHSVRLEEQFQGRKKGLKMFQCPRRSIQFRIAMEAQ
jgi:hypothetical protein